MCEGYAGALRQDGRRYHIHVILESTSEPLHLFVNAQLTAFEIDEAGNMVHDSSGQVIARKIVAFHPPYHVQFADESPGVFRNEISNQGVWESGPSRDTPGIEWDQYGTRVAIWSRDMAAQSLWFSNRSLLFSPGRQVYLDSYISRLVGDFLVGIGVVCVVALAGKKWRRWAMHRNEPQCGVCGYALVGLRSARCPECGTRL